MLGSLLVHLPDLLKDLAIMLGLAGMVSLLFRRLGQPVVLGYILAGILAGPHVPWIPTVSDIPNIQVLAELGIVFLLFSLGLEFSFAKLFKTGLASISIALIEVAAMAAAGYAFGSVLGWSVLDRVFLGGILSISSTTIIIKAIDELGLKAHRFTQTVFGVLIMEDLVAILILIALSTIAASREVHGAALLVSLGQLVLLLPLVVLSGIYLIPRILRISRRWLNDEALLIFSLGLCLGLVLLSNALGYSAALGAFVAGAILAESAEGKKIEVLVHPVRNLFGAIFFVSVGMLFDPYFLKDHAWIVAALSLLTIAGKAAATGMGALIAGQGMKASVQVGFSMAQIGEFSFIIASLGASLNVTSSILYSLAVAVALVTSFTTPYMIRGSASFSTWLENRIPEGGRNLLRKYETGLSRIRFSSSHNGVRAKMRAYADVLRRTLETEQLPYRSLVPWSAHLSRFAIEPGSKLAGKTLRDLNVRGRTGVNVLVVRRGDSAIVAPDPDELILPVDEIVVLGTDEQMQVLRSLIERSAEAPPDKGGDYSLISITLHERSFLTGRTIREAGIRESFGGLVVGIERKGTRIANPDSSFRLTPGDEVWVVCPNSRQSEIAKLSGEVERPKS
ncbi:MAG: hypothetical protein A2X94_12100 [Bdellovibrionales bacterium GWB1_55_8]|nr:MAG: hypothetical protein A2X94_12100 [Bdellovibrionales bacterium GWB1_55_8]